MSCEIEINPGNGNAFYRLGDAYTRQLKWEEAIGPLQKPIWLNPYYSGPYILLGKAYMRENQLDTAEGMLKHAVQMDPNNKSAHLAQTLQKLGRQEEAKLEFENVQRLIVITNRD